MVPFASDHADQPGCPRAAQRSFYPPRRAGYLRSDNGPEFTANRARGWLERVEVQTRFIEPDSPWENGTIKSFNGKLRDDLLAREWFDTLLEAKVLMEHW